MADWADDLNSSIEFENDDHSGVSQNPPWRGGVAIDVRGGVAIDVRGASASACVVGGAAEDTFSMATAGRFRPLDRRLTRAYGQVDEEERSLTCGSGGDEDAAWGSKGGVQGTCGSSVVKLEIQLTFKHFSTCLAMLLREMDRWLQLGPGQTKRSFSSSSTGSRARE